MKGQLLLLGCWGGGGRRGEVKLNFALMKVIRHTELCNSRMIVIGQWSYVTAQLLLDQSNVVPLQA